jgi:hypothetical protein
MTPEAVAATLLLRERVLRGRLRDALHVARDEELALTGASLSSAMEQAIAEARVATAKAAATRAADRAEAALRDAIIAYLLWPRDRAKARARAAVRSALGNISWRRILFDSRSRAAVLAQRAGAALTASASQKAAEAADRDAQEKAVADAVRALGARMDTTAASETATAMAAGERALERELVVTEPLAATLLVRQWVAMLDAKVCAVCAKLDGDEVPLGQGFGEGGALEPGHVHPRCRCFAVIVARTLH